MERSPAHAQSLASRMVVMACLWINSTNFWQ
jgi:hypothetical protein